MLSRIRQYGLTKISHSISILPLTTLSLNEISRRTTTSDASPLSSSSSVPPEGGDASSTTSIPPKYEQAMRKPIITGRRSTDEGAQPHGEVREEFPNPLWNKELPYGRKKVFESVLEEDLASGQHWHQHNDRFMQYNDNDMLDRGWGNLDLWKSPLAKRGCDDITMSHDLDYHYRLHNIGMHLEMVRYVPHLKPLWPELKQDFDGVAGKWQDIVEEILGENEDKDNVVEEKEEEIETSEKIEEFSSDSGYEKTSTKIETKKTKTKTKVKVSKKNGPLGSYKMNTTLIEDRALCGDDVIKARKEAIKRAKNPDAELSRKEWVKREIELNTIKKFVDDRVEEKDFVRLIFVDAMGTKYYVYGMVGETLLQTARRYLIPIDGYCNGFDRGLVRIYGKGPWCHLCQMDIAPKYMDVIPPFDWRERAAFVNMRHILPTSRLGCCIWIRPEFDGMLINIPVSLPNPYGRFQD